LQITKVSSESLLKACRKLLSRDTVVNVLPLGDLYSPLREVSEVYGAIENSAVIGVCSIYRAYSTPSIVFGAITAEAKQALVRKAMSRVSGNFVSLCRPDEIDLFADYSVVLQCRSEQQMIANPPKPVEPSCIEAVRVRNDELELLSKFYDEQHAEAWTPIQYKAGPYYCVKHKEQIVSAAGVHLVTPQIAQLGNIVTDEKWRGQGLGAACTSVLASKLALKGRIISLFVRRNNVPAIRMYRKLGFFKTRNIVFLLLQKK
jgi:ribosomal protein S18 acetylase RimI-like enzyme